MAWRLFIIKIKKHQAVVVEYLVGRFSLFLRLEPECSGLLSQFCDVVLVRRTLGWENPRGLGFWNGEGMEMGRSVYEQPETKVDGILSQQGGFQVSKGKQEGCKREWKEGKAEARGLRHNMCSFSCMYIIIACNCPNDCQPVYKYI